MIGARLVLEDGSHFEGELFGAVRSAAGEVVFNTGMVGYAEAMTDPSYRGQLLTLTYPLIGNYGIPGNGQVQREDCDFGPDGLFQSRRIQVAGLIVSRLSPDYSHWSATRSLDSWMRDHGVPGLCGVDTRALTKKLRTQGSMLGKIVTEEIEAEWDDPNQRNVVAEVSEQRVKLFPGRGQRRVILVDFGCKLGILRSLHQRGFDVLRVPWDYDWTHEGADGVVLSNGHSSGAGGNQADPGDLSGTPIAWSGGGRRHVQIEVRASRPESTLHRGGDETMLHHVAEPRLCGERSDSAGGLAAVVLQRQ
jgi:carbamoyl-phosphate synthase small subunit